MVGVDAGDWQIIDPLLAAGRLPHLDGLHRTEVVPTSQPEPHAVSAALDLHRHQHHPERHGILDFLTPIPPPARSCPSPVPSRREPAFWNYLTEVGVTTGVIGWLATWPAETVSGPLVTERFGFLAYAGGASAGNDEGMTWPPDYVKHARTLEVHAADLGATVVLAAVSPSPRGAGRAGAGGFSQRGPGEQLRADRGRRAQPTASPRICSGPVLPGDRGVLRDDRRPGTPDHALRPPAPP